MSYLNRLPRRIVVLTCRWRSSSSYCSFPFYWMAITAVKPNAQLTDYNNYSPFLGGPSDARPHQYLLFEPPIRAGSGTRCWWP